jgi:hypothetical protein
MSYDSDFEWQRRLLPEVKRICADHLIGEAPEREDRHHNTDLIVLELRPVRVSCRLRRNEDLHRYNRANEFTIRAARPSGAETELQKVLSGWGDYLFYGFASPDGDELAAWLLGDLSVFRLWHHRELAAGRKPWVDEQSNKDGSSKFFAYRIDALPADFEVARKPALRLVPNRTQQEA